jgi:flagella basal body P-ring formation protein FlgA
LPVDRRLRLAQCPASLVLEWYGRGRDTVLGALSRSERLAAVRPAELRESEQGGAEAISRGDMVTISVHGAGFTLSRQGEALEAGAVGEWIRVRPSDKRGDALRAQILRPGVVGMKLP